MSSETPSQQPQSKNSIIPMAKQLEASHEAFLRGHQRIFWFKVEGGRIEYGFDHEAFSNIEAFHVWRAGDRHS